MFENKNPIKNLLSDAGLSAIFRTIGCIGDSLSSGEHESLTDGVKGFHDYYEYSWGQFIARANGSTVYNFSAGGMTAERFIKSQANERLNISAEGKSCQAYIIALGVNDLNPNKMPSSDYFGSIEDVHPENPELNAETFAGYMGKIMSLIKKIQPKARIFLMTMPREVRDEVYEIKDKHQRLMYELCELFSFSYVIDLREFSEPYDTDFRKRYFLGGHMNAVGYLYTAKLVMTYIDAIINEKPEDFAQIGFVGKEDGIHNENAVW